ncbi:MAG: transporter [Vulcanimicrobiaceae bacterium]
MRRAWRSAAAIASASAWLLASSAAPAKADPEAGTVATVAATEMPTQLVQIGLSPDEMHALDARLEALTQQAAAQDAELARLRAQVQRLRSPGGTTATSAVTTGTTRMPTDVVPSTFPGLGDRTLKSAPKQRSVESIYQQQNAAFAPRLTLTPSITSTYSDNRYFTLNGFLALNAIFLGNVNVTQQRNDIRIAQLAAAYGIGPRLQVDASVPYYLRTATFSSVGANFAGQVPSQAVTRSNGIGDVQVGAYYQVRRESARSPGITVNSHVSIPTGRAPYGIRLLTDATNTNLQYPEMLPTGSGVFGYQFGASLVKSSDPAIFFGGLNYYLQTSGHFPNLQFSPAGVLTPGTAQPGDAIQYQIGTAFALNEKTSLSFAFLQTTTNATRFHPDRGTESSIVGSSTNAAALDISAGFASNARQTLITDLQFGLTQDAPNFQLTFRFPTRF